MAYTAYTLVCAYRNTKEKKKNKSRILKTKSKKRKTQVQ